MDITWENLVSGKNFITDLGDKTEIAGQGVVCRYAAWKPAEGKEEHQIVEVGNNLCELKDKYQVEDDMVLKIRV